MSDADTVRPSDVPVSPDSGNTVQVRPNGIYVGTEAVPEYAQQYVDAVDGNDTTGDGSKANPYKTIARAVDNMIPGTRGYTVYCHDGQEHVFPSRVVQGISMNFTSYPTLQDSYPLLKRIQQAWLDKYGTLLTVSTIDNVFEMATLIPDRVTPVNNVDAGGPYAWMTGLVSVNGTVSFNSIRLLCGRKAMDVPVTAMQRASMLCDYDLTGPVSYNINYSEVVLGSLPLLVQRGAGSNSTLNVYGTKITAVEDDIGKPVYIRGWGSDAPRVTAMVGGITDGVPFVTVDGVDYRQRVTTGSVEAARDNTIGVVYHGDIPVTVDAAFLFKNG